MSDRTRKANATDHDMLYGPVVATYWRYALPWALSMVATASATVVDGIFVGRYVGAMPLAAVNLVSPVWSLIFGLGLMLVTGGSVRAGRYLGEGDRQAASAMLIKTMIALAVLTGVLCLAGFAGKEDLLDLLGADETLRPYSREYLTILLGFAPVFPLCYALSYFIRLDQRPVLASVGLGLCAALNVVLDLLLVAWQGMGLRGAALATGIAYSLPCLLFATHFFSSRSSYIRPARLGGWREVLFAAWNGASECVNEVSAGFIILIFNLILMDRLGGYGVAAFTVVNYATMLGLTLYYGLGDSLASIVSVNRGAGRLDRVSAFLRTAFLSVLALGVFFFAFLTAAPDLLADLFLPGEAEAASLTRRFIHACRWSFLISGLNMVLASYFTGRQWAASSMLVAASRSFVLPLVMVLVLPRWFGDEGIFYSTVVAEALTFVLAAALSFRCGSRDQLSV